MNPIAIQAHHLTKHYCSRPAHGAWPLAPSKPIPALKDLNFEIRKGELIGLCGSNGAGKSTLLKILSRIVAPSSGIIRGSGRIYSLLELGSGFHPDLSGTENVYLNGAMLGMNRLDINQQLASICNFAKIPASLQKPVKRYSSGMLMRLALSTALHLPAEILLLDEALAVGDSNFQELSLQKIKELNQRQEKTIIMVSHNEQHINQICNRKLILIKGELAHE